MITGMKKMRFTAVMLATSLMMVFTGLDAKACDDRCDQCCLSPCKIAVVAAGVGLGALLGYVAGGRGDRGFDGPTGTTGPTGPTGPSGMNNTPGPVTPPGGPPAGQIEFRFENTAGGPGVDVGTSFSSAAWAAIITPPDSVPVHIGPLDGGDEVIVTFDPALGGDYTVTFELISYSDVDDIQGYCEVTDFPGNGSDSNVTRFYLPANKFSKFLDTPDGEQSWQQSFEVIHQATAS